jgi:hypothetical protein
VHAGWIPSHSRRRGNASAKPRHLMSEDIEEAQLPLPPAALSAPVVLVEDSGDFHRALDDLLEEKVHLLWTLSEPVAFGTHPARISFRSTAPEQPTT